MLSWAVLERCTWCRIDRLGWLIWGFPYTKSHKRTKKIFLTRSISCYQALCIWYPFHGFISDTEQITHSSVKLHEKKMRILPFLSIIRISDYCQYCQNNTFRKQTFCNTYYRRALASDTTIFYRLPHHLYSLLLHIIGKSILFWWRMPFSTPLWNTHWVWWSSQLTVDLA